MWLGQTVSRSLLPHRKCAITADRCAGTPRALHSVMRNFQETRDWLRDHCSVVMEEDNYVVLDHGKQRVRVVHRTTLGESWLAVASVIGEQDLIEPESALEYNRTNEG